MSQDTDNSDGLAPETAIDVTILEDPSPDEISAETVTAPDGELEKASPEEEMRHALADNAFKAREARRDADEAKAELAYIRSQREEEQRTASKGERPIVPPVPEDSYDSDYATQMAVRDKALQEAAAFDANERQQELNDRYAQQQKDEYLLTQQQTAQKALDDAASTYQERGVKHGLTEEQMSLAAKRVLTYPLSIEEKGFLLSDEDGPLLTKYLSENPLELDRFVDQPATPMRLVELATKVKEKATAKRMPTTGAPDPVSEVRSGGVQVENLGPKGATFM